MELSKKTCPTCGATWLNGQQYWSGTGEKGNELDLAGLVCNTLSGEKASACINPCKGMTGGATFATRASQIENIFTEFDM